MSNEIENLLFKTPCLGFVPRRHKINAALPSVLSFQASETGEHKFKMELKAVRKLLLSILVIVPCLTFVTYQSITCIQRYSRHEIGTKLSFHYPANHIFPSITICREGRTGKFLYYSSDRFNPWLNITQLDNCKFYGYANNHISTKL